jgi:hypothetical protein
LAKVKNIATLDFFRACNTYLTTLKKVEATKEAVKWTCSEINEIQILPYSTKTTSG